MLDPYHTCWWVHQHTTDLVWNPPALCGAGVSLRILLEAFRDADYIWYSQRYGDSDDNLVLIGVDRATAAHWANRSYQQTSPIMEALRDAFQLEEYLLTATILSQFTIILADDTASDSAEAARAYASLLDTSDPRIHVKLALHDDCFFSIDPVDAAVLKRLIASVLQLHSYYLGRTIAWSHTGAYLIAQLTEKHQIHVSANVKRSTLDLTEPSRDKSLFARFFRPRRLQSISIVGDHALPPSST